jgi:hypothetical protein
MLQYVCDLHATKTAQAHNDTTTHNTFIHAWIGNWRSRVLFTAILVSMMTANTNLELFDNSSIHTAKCKCEPKNLHEFVEVAHPTRNHNVSVRISCQLVAYLCLCGL